MKKVAIVGVEGSGKTVMLAGLGELYSKPDEQGYFLSPKNFATASYVADKIARMRQGEWPTATAEDVLQGLDWSLKHKRADGRPTGVCEISCLDFAGEVYREAFGIRAESGADASKEAEELRRYVREADDIIVLVNLRDVIVNGIGDSRVRESVWITKAILQYAFELSARRSEPRASIVLTQADSYSETIRACGGAKEVLEEYLRDVANNYGWLDVFAVQAVDRTGLDDDGQMIPAKGFKLDGLKPIMGWITSGTVSSGMAFKSSSARKRPLDKGPENTDDAASMPVRDGQKRSKGRTCALGSTSVQGADALFHNGLAYEMGDGCRQDYAKALAFYQDAAEKGHPEACHNAGFMYEFGKGVPKNLQMALSYYRKAAEYGNDDGRAALERLSVAPQQMSSQVQPRWNQAASLASKGADGRETSSQIRSKPSGEKANVVLFGLALLVGAGMAIMCFTTAHWWSGGVLAFVCLGTTAARGDKKTRQGAGWWILYIVLLFLSGCVALADLGWLSIILAFGGVGILNLDEKK